MNRAVLNRLLLRPAAKPLLWLLCLVPLAGWVWGGFHNTLGANPAETILRGTGSWTLRFLCIVLAVTPLRQWSGLNALARWRRMLGLYVFFYAVLHFLAYAWLDMGFDPAAVAKDLGKRPFALVGFVAFVLLVPLAATSFNRAIKAMGAARWQRLHRLVYAIALLALLHFFWMRASKHRYGEVLVYAVVLGALLGWRGWRRLRSAQPPIALQHSRVTGG
jgi:methionine sulfoxide reductase heme-binding subunit